MLTCRGVKSFGPVPLDLSDGGTRLEAWRARRSSAAAASRLRDELPRGAHFSGPRVAATSIRRVAATASRRDCSGLSSFGVKRE